MFYWQKSHIVMLFNTCLSYDTVSENLEDLFFREINDYVFWKKNRFIFILLTFYAYFKSSTTNHHITCFENSQKWHWILFSYCFVLISNESHYMFCWSVTPESPILVYIQCSHLTNVSLYFVPRYFEHLRFIHSQIAHLILAKSDKDHTFETKVMLLSCYIIFFTISTQTFAAKRFCLCFGINHLV